MILSVPQGTQTKFGLQPFQNRSSRHMKLDPPERWFAQVVHFINTVMFVARSLQIQPRDMLVARA